MFVYFVAFAHGLANAVNNIINVRAGKAFGPANGALINYIEATFLALVMVFFTGNGQQLQPGYICSVPAWAYLGGVCGFAAFVMIIAMTPKTNALAATVLVLVGNMGAATVLDYIFFGMFSWVKVLGIFLMLCGVMWVENSKKQGKQEETA